MGVLSFIEGLRAPENLDSANVLLYVSSLVFGLSVLYSISISARPLAHPDRKLGGKYKAAQAERVEILERLNSGSKVPSDAQFRDGDELRLPSADRSDVEKEPLFSHLIVTPTKEASEVTITLSNDTRFSLKVLESMKDASKAAACGKLVDQSVVFNSERTILQTEVELHDGLFERLKDLVGLKRSTPPPPSPQIPPPKESIGLKRSTPPPPSPQIPPPKESTSTLQVDSWAVLKPSGQGADLLRLPVDKVPVILHAEYTAGLLKITGLNLEDASILVSAKNAYKTVKLKPWEFLKATKRKWYRNNHWALFSDTEEDIMKLPLRLSWKEMEDVFVYATKKVQIGADGQSVDTVSKAIHITDCVWKSVLAVWLPCLLIWLFVIYNIKGLLRTEAFARVAGKDSILSIVIGPNGFYPVLWVIFFSGNSTSSFMMFLKYHLESLIRGLGQGLLLVYYGLKDLKGPHLKFHSSDMKFQLPPPQPRLSVPYNVRPKLPLDPVSLNSTAVPADAKSVDDPDWEWPAFDQYENKKGKLELKRCSEKVPDTVSPFQIMYRRRRLQLWPDVVEIDLISAPLIKIVQKALPQNGDLQSLANPKVNGRDVFTVLDDLKNHEVPASSADDTNENAQVEGELRFEDERKGGLHLKHLIRFMDKEYRDVCVRRQRMTQEKRVAWDMLWTFLTPGKKVVYACDHTQEVLAAVVSKNTYTMIQKEGIWAFVVNLDVWDYDGRSYHKCQIERTIAKFDGEVPFSSLVVRPIEIEGVPENLDEGFLANGKRFYELAVKSSHRFMHYSGPLFRLKRIEGCTRLVKENADGRVMVDLASFAKMNPGYIMGNAKPPVGTYRGPDPDRSYGRRIRFQEAEGILDLAPPTSVPIADKTLIFAPAIVYGFSFTLKQWGSFAVSGFSEICFNTNAYDALVMEPDSKQMVYKLVSQIIAAPVGPSQNLQRVDTIANKGEGCILLCYGPPGTGKTLTAESVAESLHRPLWSLTASELGGAPSELERTLVKVLDIAATWRAVLLLDEADVFLEKRSFTGGLQHNAMTGVFLRFLEYYRGVLFLTTNRIGTFDNAFRSRISMFLRYPKLTTQQKELIWMALLERAGVTGITLEFVSEVATEDLNGREIRNSIHTAQILAKSNGQILDESHVRHVTRVLLSSLTALSDTMKTSKSNET